MTTSQPEVLRRTLRPLAALAMATLIGVISAGCGSSAPSAAGTATSSGTATRSGIGSAKPASEQEKAVQFAACMRGHGVSDFPDPNTKGADSYGVSVSPAIWTKAVDACKDLAPPGALSSKLNPQQLTAALKFAQCMRKTGVKDFPDPINGEPLVDTTRIPSSDRPGGMTILNAAMQKCRPVLNLAAGGQG